MFWYSRIFFFCLFSLEQHKTEKKSQIWCNSTKNLQNALDKIISNINLIFVSILAMTESLSIIYYYMMMHIFLDIILFSLRMPLNADPEIHWSHVNFDRVTQEALLRVNIERYWVNMALLVSTDHMHPPRNHRKTFYCSCLQSISPVQRKCTLLHKHTHTPTRARSELSPSRKRHKRTQESETMIKRKLSEYIWLRASAIVWCNHSDRYHFAMRFLIVV